MAFPAWLWRWAWTVLMRWSRLQLGTVPTGSERWRVAGTVIRAGIRSYYVDPALHWALAKWPVWLVKARLEKKGYGWYRVSTLATAKHCRLRFDVYPIDVGDLVRFQGGRVSHVAYSGPRHTEILEFLPNGELTPVYELPAMRQAWAAFFSTREDREQLERERQ